MTPRGVNRNRVTVFELEEPFDLGLTLDCGQVFRAEEDSGWWRFVDGAQAYRARVVGRRLEFDGPVDGERVRHLFSFEIDLDAVRRRAIAAAPEIAGAIGSIEGFRPMRQSDAVEVLFAFLCSQNNHVGRIKRMVRHLASLGVPIAGAEWAFRFPRLEVLAALDEQSLRVAGFGYRAVSVPACARAALAFGGEEWLDSLRSAPYAEAHRALLALPGVGPKVADCVCLYGLHHGEAVPVDVHVWRRVVETFCPEWKGKTLDPRRHRVVGDLFRERFGQDAGLVQQMLFVGALRSGRSVPRGVFRDPHVDEAVAKPSSGKGGRPIVG
jgi:N-glycosylase/DNA lyase